MGKSRTKAEQPKAALPDFGKCLICGDPITIRDPSPGNDHCRNGHVYATDITTHQGFGPLPAAEISRLAKEQAERDRPASVVPAETSPK